MMIMPHHWEMEGDIHVVFTSLLDIKLLNFCLRLYRFSVEVFLYKCF